MRFLTYNTGLLDLRLFGRSLIKPADFIEERFSRLAGALLELDADIITLQEVYQLRHKRALSEALASVYPHVSMSPLRGPSVVPASLMTFSKWPMEASKFARFKSMPIAERLIDNKGFMLSTVIGPQGRITIANVHTTAGGTKHPEDPATDMIRARQITELLEQAESTSPVILAGDFNCGTVSVRNYRQLLDAGYSDVWAELHPGINGWTWDPESILNKGGTHTEWGCPAQRIDLVLMNARAREQFQPASCEVIGQALYVPTPSGRVVTLSDHYGILATLDS